MSEIRKSTAAKILNGLLCCMAAVMLALCIMIVTAAEDFGMITPDGYVTDVDYRDTPEAGMNLRHYVLQDIDSNALAMLEGEYTDQLPGGMVLRISEKDGEEIYSSIDEDDLYRSWTYEIRIIRYENKDGETDYWRTEFEEGEDDQTLPENVRTDRTPVISHYEAEAGFAKTLDTSTWLGRKQYLMEFAGHYVPYCIPAGIASGIVLLACLAFLCWSAGWKKDCDEPQNTWLGKVPFDVLTVILCGLFAAAAAVLVTLTDYFDLRILEGTLSYCCIALLFVLAYLIYVWLKETAVRLRTHTLVRNNVCSWLAVKCWDVCRWLLSWLYTHVWLPSVHLLKSFLRLPVVWKAVYLAGVCYVVLLSELEGNRHWGAESAFLYIAALIVCVLGLRYFYGIYTVSKMTHGMSEGEYPEELPDQLKRIHAEPFRTQIDDLNNVSAGLKKALDDAMKSEHLKTELITNVSHDIKTPLTSIINYADLLQKDPTEEERKEYLEKLYKQSLRLKKLTEDLVEASKASTGNIPLSLGPVYVGEILEQSLAEYDEKFSLMNLEIITEADKDLKATADGRLLWRVLSNLLSNISKYTLPGTRVYINAGKGEDGKVRITMRSISAEPLNISSEELKERFVRGDASRHTEGSGLGLNIAESLMTMMNGELNIVIDGDLFKSELVLPPA